jgi:predicted dehydrogenase
MSPVRVAICGLGWMGSTLLKRCNERNDVQVTAVLDRAGGSANQTLGQLGLIEAPVFTDVERMLDEAPIDAVVIATPNQQHGQLSIASMRAGKHVFCEKPCATRFAEFVDQIRLERANPDLITFVDYLMNFDTMEQRLRRMVAEDAFGRITQIQVNYRHGVNVAGKKAWKLSKTLQGDAIGMGIVHALSVMVMAMKSQSDPVGVFATALPSQVRPFESMPIWNILLRFADGTTGFCFGNIDSGNGYDAYHSLNGTKGAFVFDSQLDRAQKVRFWSERVSAGRWIYPLDRERCQQEGVEPWPTDTTTPDSGDVIHHSTASCVAHFIDCIQRKQKSPLSFANSALMAEIGWAAQMSASKGIQIELPLNYADAEIFFQANR